MMDTLTHPAEGHSPLLPPSAVEAGPKGVVWIQTSGYRIPYQGASSPAPPSVRSTP